MKDLVSVVITTHNRLELLKKAIESVEKQSYKNMELIIINDNSTDGTNEYLNQFRKNSRISLRVKNIYGERKGSNYARNVGLQMCFGKYICFLDDDDYWFKEKIEKQVDKIESDDKIGVVYCGFLRITDNSITTYTRPDSYFRGDLKEKVFAKIFTVTSCIMIKKEMLLAINGFDENLSHWQEYDLLIRCAQLTNIDFVDEILVIIRADSFSKDRLSNQVEGWENSVLYLHNKHAKLINNLSEDTLNSMHVNYYIDGASRYAAVGNKKMHRKYMLIAWNKSKKISHLFRYLFNLTPLRVEKIKSLITR